MRSRHGRFTVLRFAHVHCVICGTRVCPDDAISVVPTGFAHANLAHAECALVRVLGVHVSADDIRVAGGRGQTASDRTG